MAELNVMGDFKNPWSSPIDEAKHISKWTWHPGTDTWQAVYGSNSIVTGSLGQFLGIIEKQKPESIHRINVFSHGSRGLIAFAGRIDPTTGNVFLNTDTALDLRIKNTDPISKGGGVLQESMGAIARRLRDRFRKGAEIVFYLCNSGVDLELLQEMANAFKVNVRGFRQEIWFCPEWPNIPSKPPKIDRTLTSLDKCKNKKRGFRHLIPDSARNPRTG